MIDVRMQHHYFGTWHGKSEHDGVKVVAKYTLIAKQLKVDGAKLQNVEDATNYLAEQICLLIRQGGCLC